MSTERGQLYKCPLVVFVFAMIEQFVHLLIEWFQLLSLAVTLFGPGKGMNRNKWMHLSRQFRIFVADPIPKMVFHC